jgi:AraC-like DNA-binding protein
MSTAPHFRYLTRAPSLHMGRYVDHYWTLEAARCSASIEAALPDTSVELYFNLGPNGRIALREGDRSPVRLPSMRGWVLGPRRATLLVAKEVRDSHIVGVRLKPGVARSLLGVAARELTDQLVDLESVLGNDATELVERLGACDSTAARFHLVEAALVRRLAASRNPPPRAPDLCDAVAGHGSVSGVARRLGVSHRRLITFFDHEVGLKPKEFQRVERLRTVLRAIHLGWSASGARLAALAGYADQAHLVHDFRKLCGMTPGEYRAKRMSVGEGFTRYRTQVESAPAS